MCTFMVDFLNRACQSFENTYHLSYHTLQLLLLICDILSLKLTSPSFHRERLEKTTSEINTTKLAHTIPAKHELQSSVALCMYHNYP
jgi:hypothetical protein